jgi:23S rRNA pseudouridine2605 synthase
MADERGRAALSDFLGSVPQRVYHVGRLDADSEGLLLLTNDGELKRQLELPRTGVVRTYRARAFGRVTQAQLEDLADGVTVEGVHYGSINANLERRTGSNCWIEMSLTEGKNREVRRVLAHLGLQVSRLIRVAYGPFTIAGLQPGDVDEADAAELETFRRSLK